MKKRQVLLGVAGLRAQSAAVWRNTVNGTNGGVNELSATKNIFNE